MSHSVFNFNESPKNDSKQNQMIMLYKQNKLNQSFKKLLKNIKNTFGIVSCIGSNNFYTFTRQMLLHLDFNSALNLTQQIENQIEYYRSENLEQFQQKNSKNNIGIEINSPKNYRKQSVQDQLQTSFANVDSEEIKNILQTQIYQIQSQYELSHNQLAENEKQIEIPVFKKTNSSFALDGTFKNKEEKSQVKKNYIQKNQQTQSQAATNQKSQNKITQNKSGKYIDEEFHKDVQQFKKSLETKKIQQLMKKKGFSKVSRDGEIKFLPKNDFIRVYNSKQIGTDKEKKPIEWIYAEVKDLNQSNVQSAYLLSSTIIYELPFQKQPNKEEFEKQIKNYFQFYRKMESQVNKFDDSVSDMAEVVLVCPIEDSQTLENRKSTLKSIFNQLQSFYLPQNKKNLSHYQSPYSQYQNSQSPSKSKLPPTPKRLPMSHKPTIESGNPSSSFKKKIRLEFRIVSEELSKSGIFRENYSRMRQITSIGRDIFNEQNVKSFGGNLVYTQCYISLLDKIQSKIPHIEIQQFYQQWQFIYSEFLKKNMQQTLNKYQQKIHQLIVGKNLVSQSRLLQAHQAAKKQTLKQFTQKKIGNSRVYIQSCNSIKSALRLSSNQNISHSRKVSIMGNLVSSRKLVESRKQLILQNQEGSMQEQPLINIVQSRIQGLKEEIQQKNKIQSKKWAHKFLDSQYEIIKRKIKINQIKSVNGYRHELQFLRDIFKKKLDNYSAFEYDLMQQFQLFVFEKVFQGIQSLVQKQRLEWKQKINRQSIKIQQIQSKQKQLQKQYQHKQRQLIQKTIQNQNHLHQLQQSLQTLSKQLQQKTNLLLLQKQQHQIIIQNKQNKNKQNIKQTYKQKQQINNKLKQKTQQLMYVESQLEKEQLLHKQTHQNYEQILLNYKNNISQLEKKIKGLKQQKNNSIKEQESKQNNQVQNNINCSQSNQQQQQQLQQKYQQMQNSLHSTREQIYQLSNRLTQKSTENTELQLSNKLLEEKLIQIQSRLPRYKSQQQLVQKLQKQKQQLLIKIQLISSNTAVSQQKCEFMKQSIKELENGKNKIIEKMNTQMIEVKQQIKLYKQDEQKLKQQVIKLKEQYNSLSNSYKHACQQLSVVKKTQIQHSQKLMDYQNRRSNSIQIETQTITKQNSQKCLNCKQNSVKLKQALQLIEQLNESYQIMRLSSLKTEQLYECKNCKNNYRNGNHEKLDKKQSFIQKKQNNSNFYTSSKNNKKQQSKIRLY